MIIIVVILPRRPNALFLFVNKLKVKIVLFKIRRNLFFSIRQTRSTEQTILIKNIKPETKNRQRGVNLMNDDGSVKQGRNIPGLLR